MKTPARTKDEIAQVRMLPPSYALYLRGAVFAPIFVKLEPATIFVPPLLLARSVHRIIWNLVLLKEPSSKDEIEFAPPWLDLKDRPGEKLPQTALWQLSPTQVCLDIEPGSPAREALRHDYSIYFQVTRGGRLWRKVVAKMIGDPTVGVSDEPVDLPTWP